MFQFLHVEWHSGNIINGRLTFQFNEEARSPFVKKYKTIIHPGEVCFDMKNESWYIFFVWGELIGVTNERTTGIFWYKSEGEGRGG